MHILNDNIIKHYLNKINKSVNKCNKVQNEGRWIVIREKIRNELINLEYDFANIGTIYLLDIIEMVCQKENVLELLSDVEKNLYSFISKKYNKNIKTVKSNIVTATNKAHTIRCLKYDNKISKNTAKTVINLIVDKIKKEQ